MVESAGSSNRISGQYAAATSGGSGRSGATKNKHFVKVVVIGDSFVGKTSLIQMFEHNRFTENFKPTIGADFSNKEIQLEDGVVIL